MSESNIVSHKQVEEIKSTDTFVELTYKPLVKTLWFIFDECKNVILYNYKIYNGYVYSDTEDVRLICICDEVPKDSVEYVTYIRYTDPIALKFLSVLIGKICINYDKEVYEMVTEELINESPSSFYKNLVGKYFIDWSISEQIKNMLTKNNVKNLQINYWYQF